MRGQPAGSGQITFNGADITKELMVIGRAILSNPKLLLLAQRAASEGWEGVARCFPCSQNTQGETVLA